MAKARALDKRRKSIRNIRKITRTMELIATARFKKAMDRAHAATAYTRRITQLVSDLANSGLEVTHPLLEGRDETKRAILLVLTGNRGLCGGYNSNVVRQSFARFNELKAAVPHLEIEISGKRGISAFRYRGVTPAEKYTQFEDKVTFAEIDALAKRYLAAYAAGSLDRLDVAYMQFHSVSRQAAVVETLLPLGSLAGAGAAVGGRTSEVGGGAEKSGDGKVAAGAASHGQSQYEFLPSAASILEEVVPTSFKVKLFKCFLDSAVSEQIARMVAMKSATENADKMIKSLSRAYNRARQSQITGEIMEVLGGVEALKG
ncbi:MAG TPA: ATP synthase F1 subunit gamma [Pirellulales bacterium]|jgi:F-type H+-transporting ATPase subunit gamma|nr:ATP synthase F1 subunit gamma [Pirellulales bacterium]